MLKPSRRDARFLPVLILIVSVALAACRHDTAADAVAPAQPTLPPGITLVESYAGDDSGFSIPFSKYVLDNGLTVILHEDHSDPLAYVDLSFHVGSNREEPGRSGFAHFFEHMMFEGSKHVPQGEHSKIITEAGGNLNGTTSSDRTTYYESIPVNQLEIALWLEADRMGFLLEAVDEEKFEVQRETVKNERGQRVDNVPYGRTSETMMKNLYSPEHPYSWPVIGWPEDLNAATLYDIERFFLRWYGPNNAQLSIGGAIDVQQTLEWVAKYFGPLPGGPAVEKLTPQPASLEVDRYVTLEDNIHLPALAILIPTVSYFHPDEAPLDAAAKILGQGKASLLYQRLVQTGRAVSVYVSHACRELACEMAFIVVQNPASGETLAEMEAAIRETWTEFSERGVSADDLDKFKAQVEAGRIFGMQSVAGKMGALAYSEMFNGDPKVVQLDLERYAAVTPEDVTRAFTQYIEHRPGVVLSIVPKGEPGKAAREANYGIEGATNPDISTESDVAEAETPPQLPAVKDNFDRTLKPQAGANPGVDLPAIRDTRLANGVRVLGVPNAETPTVSVQLVFDVGQRDEPPGKAGLASLTAALMNEASKQRSAAEFSEALERIGASVGVGSGTYESTVSLNVLAKHFDKGMALLEERALQPAFTEEDFDRVKSQTLEGLRQAQKSGPSLAGRAVSAVLAGPTHLLSYPGSGLPSTVEGITLEDVRAFHAQFFPSRLKGVLVSSSLPLEQIDSALATLGNLPVSPAARPEVEDLKDIRGRTIYLIDKPGATQSSVRITHRALPYDALGDYYRSGLLNFNLGGTFDSRINLNIREDKGWSYGAYTRFSGGPEFGSFQFSGEINGEATGQAIAEVLAEMEKFVAGGLTAEEFQYMQNSITQSEALLYETPGRKLGLLGQILSFDLPLDYRKQQQAILREASLEALNELAPRVLHPHDVAIVVVGDAESLRPQLEALQFPIRMLDVEGFEITAEP